MTAVGLVGGLGPESTIDYYRRILVAVERRHASAAPRIVIDSLDVRRALHLVERDRDGLVEYLLESLQRLAAAGVDFAALTANTPHIVFDELAARSPVPLLSMVEACADEARRLGARRLGLLGTRFTMEAPFYPEVGARHGIAIVAPDEETRCWVHERYIHELLQGDFRDETREEFVSLVRRLRDEQGIDGVILGGTELPLLLPTPEIAGLPVLDTTAVHVEAIVRRLEAAVGDESTRPVQAARRPLAARSSTPGAIGRMEYRFEDAVPVLRRTPGMLRALLVDLPDAWTQATEGEGTWSAFDVMGHLLHGERTDWMPRVEHILRHGDAVPFPPFDRDAMFESSRGLTLTHLLDAFDCARTESLDRLTALGLTDADLGRCGRHPEFGLVTLGQHLSTWVAHDLCHISQIVRIMAKQYTDAIGPWRAYLSMLRDA